MSRKLNVFLHRYGTIAFGNALAVQVSTAEGFDEPLESLPEVLIEIPYGDLDAHRRGWVPAEARPYWLVKGWGQS